MKNDNLRTVMIFVGNEKRRFQKKRDYYRINLASDSVKSNINLVGEYQRMVSFYDDLIGTCNTHLGLLKDEIESEEE